MENISGGPILDIMFPLIKDYYSYLYLWKNWLILLELNLSIIVLCLPYIYFMLSSR